MVNKMNGESVDLTAQNIARLKELFPEILTDGEKIDFDMLKALLGGEVDSENERYQFTWHGKKKMIAGTQKPSKGTLRPDKEKSKNFDTTENLYIEGDNLEVLKLLQKSYNGKVKMIYIDPPYNTGKDFVYKDNFKDGVQNYLEQTGQADSDGNILSTNAESNGRFHTDWLNMMYPRLKLAKNLLTEDGVIFISIDESEQARLRLLCDDIFGENNFCGEIIWKNSSKNDQNYISMQHEYIICYVKNKKYNKGDWKEKKEGLDEIYKAFEKFKSHHGENWEAIHKEALTWFNQLSDSNPIKKNKHYTWMDERGIYFPDNISGPNDGQYRYTVIHPKTGKPCKEPKTGWRFPKEKMIQLIAENKIHFGKDETTVPNNKTYLKNTEYQSLTSVKYKDGRVASKALDTLFGTKVFTNPKDTDLLVSLMKAVNVGEDDYVLDFFSGSGTTAQAVMQLNAESNGNTKFILIQLPQKLEETLKTANDKDKKVIINAMQFLESIKAPYLITEIGKERIRRAGEKIKAELVEKQQNAGMLDENTVNPESLDIGFKVLKLDTSNIREWNVDFVDLKDKLDLYDTPFVEGRSELDVVYEIMLKQGLELTYPIETFEVNGQTVYDIAFGSLFVCLSQKITTDIAKAIIARRDEQGTDTSSVIFSDAGFETDSDKLNCIEILKDAGYPEDNLLTL